jgi:hypothetical protein
MQTHIEVAGRFISIEFPNITKNKERRKEIKMQLFGLFLLKHAGSIDKKEAKTEILSLKEERRQLKEEYRMWKKEGRNMEPNITEVTIYYKGNDPVLEEVKPSNYW